MLTSLQLDKLAAPKSCRILSPQTRIQMNTDTTTNPKVPGANIPYQRFLDCVHCGLCTSSCPTYVETGDENDSPRGRIHLMRAVVDERLPLTNKVRHHLDLCLDCRSCETSCPSGVQYGRLLEPFKVDMHRMSTVPEKPSQPSSPQKPDWFHRWILHGLFPYRNRMTWALKLARIMQRLKLDRLLETTRLTQRLPARLQRMQRQLHALKPSSPSLPHHLSAIGKRQATVGLFVGCVADAMLRHIHWATIRVLQQNGCDVIIPKQQGCCGAIHYHSAAAEPAAKLMEQNLAAFNVASLDAVVVNVAGCGAMLKDYNHIAKEISSLIQGDIEGFVNCISDINEFLADLPIQASTGRIDATVVYQDACHLQHAQKIKQQPRQLLNMIPGLTLIDCDESELCCGAAGSYNLTQPKMSDRLGNRKLDHLLASQPDIIASANAGCSLQLQALLKERGLNIPVVHPIELLDVSYQNQNWRTVLS